ATGRQRRGAGLRAWRRCGFRRRWNYSSLTEGERAAVAAGAGGEGQFGEVDHARLRATGVAIVRGGARVAWKEAFTGGLYRRFVAAPVADERLIMVRTGGHVGGQLRMRRCAQDAS